MKVIAPIDGTSASQPAIDALLGMKWHPGTEIKLLTVLPPAMPAISGHANTRVSLECTRETWSCAEEGLLSLARDLQQHLVDCEITATVRQGDPKTEILALCVQWQANLIVIGSRGNKGLDLLLLGSVSQAVLNESPCPVIIVKSEGRQAVRDLQRGFKRVILTLDNSVYAKAAVRWLCNVEWPQDTQFKLLTVVEAIGESFSFETNTAKASWLLKQHEQLTKTAESELNKIADQIRSARTEQTVEVEVARGEPKRAILEAAEGFGADLIVMGSHGRGGLKKLILGSVSQAVSVQSPCSVAIVRGLVKKGPGQMQRTGLFKKSEPYGAHQVERVRYKKPEPAVKRENPHVPFGGMM